jgi:hypothetical protein
MAAMKPRTGDGPMEVTEDGMIYSLPAANQSIEVRKAF